ncbi:MAG: hypothetical protein L6R39_004670 [Caloplaca ligustica]|nr:MAG: hypothetical protein L6R39_004670 [Caloplaca ligustica]
MYWSGILALLGWAATAIAQGNAGGDQTATCSAAQNYTYVGCYDDTQNGGKANFPFLLSTVAGNLKSYPGYTSSANLTIDVCATACRGHGHRYAGLYRTTTGGLGGYAGTNPGGRVANSFCGTPCPANSSQTCGGTGYLQVHQDPTVPVDTSPPTLGAAGNYLYFGCITGANGGTSFMNIKTPSTISCQNYCGLLGYAYSIRNNLDSVGTTTNNCGCGPELPAGLQVAETTCNRYCNGTTGASGGAGTCGGGGAYSVYFNSQLEGCYVVRQPGVDATHTYVAPANARVACTAPVCSGVSSSSSTVTSTTATGSSTVAGTTSDTTSTPSSSTTSSPSTLVDVKLHDFKFTHFQPYLYIDVQPANIKFYDVQLINVYLVNIQFYLHLNVKLLNVDLDPDNVNIFHIKFGNIFQLSGRLWDYHIFRYNSDNELLHHTDTGHHRHFNIGSIYYHDLLDNTDSDYDRTNDDSVDHNNELHDKLHYHATYNDDNYSAYNNNLLHNDNSTYNDYNDSAHNNDDNSTHNDDDNNTHDNDYNSAHDNDYNSAHDDDNNSTHNNDDNNSNNDDDNSTHNDIEQHLHFSIEFQHVIFVDLYFFKQLYDIDLVIVELIVKLIIKRYKLPNEF